MLLISSLGSSGYAARRLDEEYARMVTSKHFDRGFGEVVSTRSETYRAFVKKLLKDLFESNIDDRAILRQFTISEFGSAARNEKGNSSKVDIIITGVEPIVEDIRRMLEDSEIRQILLEVDPRPVGQSSVLYYDKEGQHAYPCRTIDQVPLFKISSNNVESCKSRLLEELKTEYARVIEKVDSRKRAYKKIVKNDGVQIYKGNPIKHYDLEEGVMNYHGDTEVYGSFKISALRFIQNQILQEIIKRLRNLSIDDEGGARTFLENLPQNTKEKLFYIKDTQKTTLGIQEIRELAELYEYFLWLYHKSQYEFEKNKISTLEIPDCQQTRENLKNIIKLTEKGIISN